MCLLEEQEEEERERVSDDYVCEKEKEVRRNKKSIHRILLILSFVLSLLSFLSKCL